MENHTVTVDVGNPTNSCDEQITILFRFHGFEELFQAPMSKSVSAFGCGWKLILFPRGTNDSGRGTTAFFFYRDKIHTTEPDVNARITLLGRNSEEIKTEPSNISHPGGGFEVERFLARPDVMKHLHDGTLCVKVQIERNDISTNLIPKFVPTNPFSSSMLKLLSDEESADVVFEFSGSETKHLGGRKKAKTTSSERCHAHRLILKSCAPALAALCESSKGVAVVPIKDETPEIFRLLLTYIYGGEIAANEMKQNSKSLIGASDKYGITSLKLEAESCYVNETEITVENAMDNLLYADAKNCALLKEAVMDFFVTNGHKVVRNVSMKDVPGNLFSDLMFAVARGKPDNDSSSAGKDREEAPDFSIMRVNSLRAMCQKKGLSADGSRESLIASLQNTKERDGDIKII